MSKPKTKDELLKWLKFWFSEPLAPGSLKEEEQAYNQIKSLIQNQPEVDEEEIDDLVDGVIDIVLQNSYVVSEKTSDGSGREYYDNQLFPEKGCEEKVKKLLQRK